MRIRYKYVGKFQFCKNPVNSFYGHTILIAEIFDTNVVVKKRILVQKSFWSKKFKPRGGKVCDPYPKKVVRLG